MYYCLLFRFMFCLCCLCFHPIATPGSNGGFKLGRSPIFMVHGFQHANCLMKLEGKSHQILLNHHFPMVFLWFSYDLGYMFPRGWNHWHFLLGGSPRRKPLTPLHRPRPETPEDSSGWRIMSSPVMRERWFGAFGVPIYSRYFFGYEMGSQGANWSFPTI